LAMPPRGQSAAANPSRRGRRLLGKSVTDSSQSIRGPGKEAFVRYVVACRAGHYRCRAERTFWAYPVSCVWGVRQDGNPAQGGESPGLVFRVVVFVIIGSCPSLPAGDCRAGVVLLTGTAIVPPSGFIFRAGDGALPAACGLSELRIVVEVAGLARLEEGD